MATPAGRSKLRNYSRGIQGHLVLLLLIMFASTLLIGAYVFYESYRVHRSEHLQANLEIARSLADTFEAFVQDVLHQELAMGLAITSSQPMTPEDITRLLRQTQLGQIAVRDFSWVNRDGVFLYSSNPAMVGLNNSDRSYFRDIAEGREWTVGELVLARTTGKPVFGITRGLRDAQGILLGVVVATIIPERLDAVISFERSEGGGIGIVDHKGMLVYRYPNINLSWEERNWGRLYPEYEDVFKGKEVAKTFHASHEGRNRLVGLVPIASIGWAAGAGRAEDVAMEAITASLLPQTISFLFATLVIFGVALVLSRRISNPVAELRNQALALGRGEMESAVTAAGPTELKELAESFNTMAYELRSRESSLREQREWLRVTLSSIGDAVIAADAAGRVTFINPIAAELTGWQQGEAEGETIQQVFRIINEQTRKPAEDIVERVLRDGKLALLANHTALISRDGREMPIEDSAAPIRDESGNILGVVLVFHDVTEKRKAQQLLNEANRRLTVVLDSIADGFYALNTEMRFTHINDAALRYFRRTREELIGNSIYDVFPHFAGSVFDMAYRRAMSSGEPEHLEAPAAIMDRTVETHAYPGPDNMTVLFRDVTERKRMEEEICRARDELESRVQERTRELTLSEEAVQRANRALLTINACNRALIRDTEELDLLNHVCEIIVQVGGYRMAWVGLAEPDEKKQVRPVASAGYDEGYLEAADISWADTERGRGPTGLAIREGKIHIGRNMETQPNLGPWRAEGLKRGYASSIALPLTVNGRTYGALTIYASEADAFSEEETKLLASLADNLSYGIASIQVQIERKLAEERIARANAMLETVFDGISDPLFMVERDYRIRMLNEASCKYFHIANAEDVIAKPCCELAPGRCGPCDNCAVTLAISGNKKTAFERKGLFELERIEQVTVYPVDEAVGGVSGAIIRISDITESRNMERHLIRADRLSSLGVLAGGIAHEIRNPLAGVNLFIDVLGDEGKFSRSSKEQEILAEIKTNIKRIDGIIKRVLAFSRQSDATTTDRLTVKPLIEDSLKLWQSKMAKDGIRHSLFVEENLAEVIGDPIEIQQVLNNLIQNAVEAMEKEGTLSISARNGTLSFDKKRPAVIMKVQDSGAGIPPDQQKNVFNPFFTTKHTGTGLGLAISHRIISRHGGLISFESTLEVGTTFTVELPAVPGN